jgi:hypothetical protein
VHRTEPYLDLMTPTLPQRRRSAQIEQRGEMGAQTFFPYVTSRSFISSQCRFGRTARRANSVSFGFRVETAPSRFTMRWTCVSTHMPGLPKASVTTRLGEDRLRLGTVETGRIDQPRYLALAQTGHLRRAFRPGEKALTRRARHLVLGPRADDGRDEDSEGRSRPPRDLGDGGIGGVLHGPPHERNDCAEELRRSPLPPRKPL